MKELTYEKGLNDAWKLASQIRLLDAKDLDFIMKRCYVTSLTQLYSISPKNIMKEMELLHKNQVKTGDVIQLKGDNNGEFYLCTKDNLDGDNTMCQLLASDGTAYTCQKRNCIKTDGRINIDNVLKELR